jgi:hypothetical protein
MDDLDSLAEEVSRDPNKRARLNQLYAEVKRLANSAGDMTAGLAAYLAYNAWFIYTTSHAELYKYNVFFAIDDCVRGKYGIAEFSKYYLAVLPVAIAILFIWLPISLLRQRFGKRDMQLLKQRLQESRLITRLISGWEQLPDIYSYVHKLNHIFMIPRPVKDRRWVYVVAANLDWFCEKPVRLLRPNWIYILIIEACFVLPLAILSIAAAVEPLFALVLGKNLELIVSRITISGLFFYPVCMLLVTVVAFAWPPWPVSLKAKVLIMELKQLRDKVVLYEKRIQQASQLARGAQP